MTRVLVLGATGWLGSRYVEDCRAHGEIVASVHLDVLNIERLRHAVAVVQPDLVINCAGKTHSPEIPNIDACMVTQSARSETCQVNAVGAGIVATVCAESGAKLVHLASGCIFDGDDRVFSEDDPPNPVSWYAQTKVWGDQLVSAINPSALILRIRMPISGLPHPRNLITKLSGTNQVIDVTNSVTVVEDLLDWTRQLVAHGVSGIVHAVHPQPVSYQTLMSWYLELVDPSYACTFIPKAQLQTHDGRSNCVLSTRPLPIQFTDTEPAVRRALRAYASAKVCQ